jgi:hypothetical protein
VIIVASSVSSNMEPSTKRERASAAEEQQLHDYADGGPAIGGPLYSCLVPEGDPPLQRLIAAHGNDKINREVLTIATARALRWQLPERELKRARMPA